MVAEAMVRGLIRHKTPHKLKSSRLFKPHHAERGGIAIFYGLAEGLAQVLRGYPEHGTAFYIDLGYWGRRKRNRYDGYHKIIRNGRHPTDYFQQKEHGPDRFNSHNVTIQPWKKRGDYILVAGMSAKAAYAEGLTPEIWEREAIAKLRKITDREIIYRPKPNWTGAKPIAGSTMDCQTPLAVALERSFAVVTRHSNVAVDALMAGVPCICPKGVASVLSQHDVGLINELIRPDGREQFANDLAWTQWSMAEMQNGNAWEYMKTELL